MGMRQELEKQNQGFPTHLLLTRIFALQTWRIRPRRLYLSDQGYLNVWPSMRSRLIPLALWEYCTNELLVAEGKFTSP